MVLSVVFAMVSMVFTACNDEGDEEIKDNGGEETVLSGLKLLNNREIDRQRRCILLGCEGSRRVGIGCCQPA